MSADATEKEIKIMAKTNVATKEVTKKAVAEKKVAVKTTAPKTEKKVAEKKPAEKKAEPKPKADYKAIAESIEKAFKADKSVDVIADTNREYPKSVTYTDYSFIHFYNPGTEKDMFQLYITGKSGKFIIKGTAADYLDKSVEYTPSNRYILVKCPIDLIPEVAKKVIAACQSIPAKEKPTKATKKTTEKKEEKVAK